MTRKSRRGTRVPTRTIPTTRTSSSPEREQLECERETETRSAPLSAEERESRRHAELAGPWRDELGMPIATCSIVGDDPNGDWDAWQYECGIICLRGRDARGVLTVGAGVISDTADAIVSLPPLRPIAEEQGAEMYSHLLWDRNHDVTDEQRAVQLADKVKLQSLGFIMAVDDPEANGDMPRITVTCSARSSPLPEDFSDDNITWGMELSTEDIISKMGDDKRDVGLHLMKAGYAHLCEVVTERLRSKAFFIILDKLRERRSSERAATGGTDAT